MDKTGSGQAGLMGRDCVGAQHVFQQGALLADFQLAVAIGAFEIQMQIDDEIADRFIFEFEFFAQNEQSTRPQTLVDALHQG